MKRVFSTLWGVVLAIVISGCVSEKTDPLGPITLTDGVGDKIAIDVEILEVHETYRGVWKMLPWRGKAELYLKIYDKKNPEISLLYPLNVEREDSGTRKFSLITPFEYGAPTVLVVELLDDDGLDKEEEKLLVEAARTGALIVCDAAAAYKSDYKAAEAIFRNKDGIASLAAGGAEVLAQNLNQHKFDSVGIYEYTVTGKGGIFLNNAVTILNNDDKTKAHCNLKFYAVDK